MKLFVTDYDNTLYIDEESMKLNIQKLNELKKQDYIIVISTGRSISSIKEKILEYNIPFDYINCADGSASLLTASRDINSTSLLNIYNSLGNLRR